MEKPVIYGISLNSRKDVIEALTVHGGGDDEAVKDTCLFDDYAAAVAGFTENNEVVYDYNRMVQTLMERDGMSQEDAAEFINYNAIRILSCMKKPPVILYPVDGYEEEKEEES